jgi:hypothetical protein
VSEVIDRSFIIDLIVAFKDPSVSTREASEIALHVDDRTSESIKSNDQIRSQNSRGQEFIEEEKKTIDSHVQQLSTYSNRPDSAFSTKSESERSDSLSLTDKPTASSRYKSRITSYMQPIRPIQITRGRAPCIVGMKNLLS